MYQYRDCKKCSKNIENWKCPKMAMMMEDDDDDRDLEAMYPNMYFALLPMVQKHCDKMEEKHGEMHTPNKEELDEILDDLVNEVEPNLDNMMRDETGDFTRQIPPGRIFRDLLGIVYVDEMRGRRRRRRRRRPYPPYPPYGRPGYPGYPGYPQYPHYPGYPGY